MRFPATGISKFLIPVFCAVLCLGAKPATPSKAPTAAQMKAQIKTLETERDTLKEKLSATASLQDELASAQKSRDLARQEAETWKAERDQLKAIFAENQSSGDTMLKELQTSKEGLASSREKIKRLEKQLSALEVRLQAPTAEGTLVILGKDITPARPMNVRKVTPEVKKVHGALVVVNVLVSENGEVLDVALLQGVNAGIPADQEKDERARAANDACLESAKRLVFDPARTVNGTRVRVWQGVGFYLD